MQANINNSPSFCGITRYLNREIYDNIKVQKRLLNLSEVNFVGELPREILQDIISLSKTPQEKKENIFKIMTAFVDVAKKSRVYDKLEYPQPSIWEKFISKFLPEDKIYKQLRFSHTKSQIDTFKNFLDDSGKRLSTAFKEVGLINKWNKIKIEYVGKGCSGSVFKISFPKRTGYSSKVLKVFKDSDLQDNYSNGNLLDVGTNFHEINSIFYIKNAHRGKGFKSSEYVEGYFGSLKDKFMMLEDVNNYLPQKANEHFKIDHDLNLMLWDKSTENNVVNGRVVDYGYIQMCNKIPYFLSKNPGIRK